MDIADLFELERTLECGRKARITPDVERMVVGGVFLRELLGLCSF